VTHFHAGRPLLIVCLAAPLFAQARLWQDPASLPPPAPPPRAPFTFLREDPSGTQPKFFVRDAAGSIWNVKFGYEVKNESFCWRIVRACGYLAEPSYFVASGQIQNWKALRRQTSSVTADGHFTDARFQYRDENLQFVKNRNWRWDRPPLVGTRELSGLKILIMLFSNWDNKDGRVGNGGPNTGMFRFQDGTIIYAFTDWGSGMGRWGSQPGTATNWRCADFAEQTPSFVKGVAQGRVVFGWDGAINEGFRDNIPPGHVAWFLRYLGAIDDAAIHSALLAAGASGPEADCFTLALRSRISQLQDLAR
jgi:hypothetical protein